MGDNRGMPGSVAQRIATKMKRRASGFKGKLDCRTTNKITFRLIILASVNAIRRIPLHLSFSLSLSLPPPIAFLHSTPRDPWPAAMLVFATDNFPRRHLIIGKFRGKRCLRISA